LHRIPLARRKADSRHRFPTSVHLEEVERRIEGECISLRSKNLCLSVVGALLAALGKTSMSERYMTASHYNANDKCHNQKEAIQV
jgi:hypothetical protein